MMEKSRKTNLLFFSALFIFILFHLVNIFAFLPREPYDEVFYTSIPLRLVNGESLIQDEWHLSQFSSLFSFLPVRFWTMINGSTDGLLLFMRLVYFSIHTTIAVVIYRFFKNLGYWAIAVSLMFYTQISYGIYAISYNSMFALFLLLFTFGLLAVYKKHSPYLYVFTGFCYGACCVNNPIFIIVFVLYLVLCILWTGKDVAIKTLIRIKETRQKNIDLTKEKKDLLTQQVETYNCFFSKKAILYFCAGIGVMAVICIIFYFSTGGTLHSISRNIGNMLNSSEYGIVSLSLGSKIITTIQAFKTISFDLWFILPLFYVFLLSDKTGSENRYRLIYLILAFLISVFYMFGISRSSLLDGYFFSLPFAVFSNTCYILTERKNKPVFYCIWVPCVLGSIANFLASNTLLVSVGVVVAISNVAGVVFTYDLFKELSLKQSAERKNILIAIRTILCFGIIIQMLFNCFTFSLLQTAESNPVRVSVGPYEGFSMNEDKYDNYISLINDLDLIKDISDENDPVLILSGQIWTYIYIDRPFAAYTTWNVPKQSKDNFIEYYKQNNDNVPKYIYVQMDPDDLVYFDETSYADWIYKNFNCTKEILSTGILLTVDDCKFALN